MLPGSRTTSQQGLRVVGAPANKPANKASQQGGPAMGMLDGKTAIVTGAGRGIGREEALLLA
ncbi:MAG: hypothetical protein ACRDV4_12160, partial [Acidimicrobiales bacterium]